MTLQSRGRAVSAAAVLAVLTLGCASREAVATRPSDDPAERLRQDAIARADVWRPTNVAAMNMRRGPGGAGSFAPEAVVDCVYVDRDMSGATPKITCRLSSGRDVKVKFGRDNGEVYAEVAATRLLWALGFGADHMYPVRVRCRGCPHGDGQGEPTPKNEITMLDTAAIERKMAGEEINEPGGEGWSWDELEGTDARRGGATVAERDALKLLAAMLQHTDSKRNQQRLVCLEPRHVKGNCRQPFMFIADVGKTFGRANLLNKDQPGSVNLKAWASVPVWEDGPGCRANLGRSITGTLVSPVISEPGRKFLADLLARLTDRQLRDLFTVARFPQRAEAKPGAEAQEIEAWVRAFKAKVSEIQSRTCSAGASA
jgi:hypothetical protein